MFTLVWTAHFTRSAEKFKKRHPELKKGLPMFCAILKKTLFSRTFIIIISAES
jgi:hypothetical protein